MPSVTDWRPTKPTYSVFTRPLRQSPNDYRKYQIITLENGLEAILVHDPKTDQAAASVTVRVGAESDPDDIPGLAHLCEHLSFMGTKLFPAENEYEDYIARNSGSCNANVCEETTNYHFSVSPPALHGALERLSAIFHCPLFPSTGVMKAINAVHSEFTSTVFDDERRMDQLKKHLSRKGHSWRRFGLGNRKSLTPKVTTGQGEAREIRRRAIEWWNDHYCASKMRLCVIGREPLSDLARMVSNLFSPIKRLERPPPYTPSVDHPYGPEERGRLILAHATESSRTMRILCPMESQMLLWATQPASFLSYLVGHEGHGSLDAYLKTKGWITSLFADHGHLDIDAKVFIITIELTVKGFKQYRSVLATVFHALATFRHSPFPSYLHRERVTLSDIDVRFLERIDTEEYAQRLSRSLLPHVPEEEILSFHWLRDWSKAAERKVRQYLKEFNLENATIILSAQPEELGCRGAKAVWETEPWYGTKFSRQRISRDFLSHDRLPNDIPSHFFPEPNEYIPTRMISPLRTAYSQQAYPRILRQTSLTTLWYAQDETFLLPKASLYLQLESPYVRDSALNAVLNQIYIELIKDYLAQDSYCAMLAGLEYEIERKSAGALITVHGYNEKLVLFVQRILDCAQNLEIGPGRFKVIKEKVLLDLKNSLMDEPYVQAERHLKLLVDDPDWSVRERLHEIESITPDEVDLFKTELLEQAHMRILVYGALDEESAILVSKYAERGLDVSSPSPGAVESGLPLGSSSTRTLTLSNPDEGDSAVTYYLQYGSASDQRLRVTGELLTNMMEEPFFHRLQTTEQLGYHVWTNQYSTSRQVGLQATIQSEGSSDYCASRIEAFFESYKTVLENMPLETFKEYKKALYDNFTKAPENMKELAERYWEAIQKGHGEFDRAELDAAFLTQISKRDVLSVFMSCIHASSPTRTTLAIHMLSQCRDD